MRLLLYTAPTPAEDLALEEAIHTCVEERLSPHTWRLWQAAAPAVILGTGQESAKEADLDRCREENVPVLRRHSGGGTVVIGPGAINFSVFFAVADLPGSDTIRGAMSAALKPVVELLTRWKMEACEAGLSDLAVKVSDGTLRKIAGNSQARKKVSVVVHGTMLADPDWARITRLLRFPSSVPDYRAGRDHRSFLTSLKENAAPHDLAAFSEGLRRHLPSGIYIDYAPREEERVRGARLLAEKYAASEWNFRR
jgi:lipoate---protein ligase